MRDMPSEIKNGTPEISIGLVVYNGIEHIRNALDSIVRQSYRNIELIVVDGGSTDGTQNVLKEYAEHISVLVSEPDKGIYDAMNKVCTLATGDWLIFLGCDDVLLDVLGNIVGQMTNPDFIYYGDVIFRSSGKIYCGKFSKYRLMNRNICHQALFYPKSVYKKYFYNLNYKWLADHDYNIRLFGKGLPFVYLGVVVSIFNDKGAGSHGDAEFEKKRLELIRESFGIPYFLMKMVRNQIVKVVKNVIGLKS